MKVMVIGSVPRSLVNFRGPLLRAMVERGHEVIACAPNADRVIQTQLSEIGVKYTHVPIQRAKINPAYDLATLRRLIQLYRKERPDLVLCYTIKPVIWGLLAARVAGINKRFAMITGVGYTFAHSARLPGRALHRVVCALYRVALYGSTGIFFQNPDDEADFHARKLLTADTPTIRINGSGVDLAHFSPQPLPEQPVFLLIARLIADKGVREYQEAAGALRSRYPAARFLMAGALDANPNSITAPELQQWQNKGHIEYLGKLDDVRPALKSCAVYVLPSYREGTPRTVLEAMASARPIITSDAPGCRETVQHGVNGYLVPPASVTALAEAMENLIEDSDLRKRMAMESLRIATDSYDVNRVNDQIVQAMGL